MSCIQVYDWDHSIYMFLNLSHIQLGCIQLTVHVFWDYVSFESVHRPCSQFLTCMSNWVFVHTIIPMEFFHSRIMLLFWCEDEKQ